MIKHQIKSYLENAKQVFSIKFISVGPERNQNIIRE